MAIIKLCWYFGLTGILSIAGWATAFALLARHPRSAMSLRTRRFWVAFLAGALGLWLAGANWSNVSAIRVDQSEEIEKQRIKAEKREIAKEAERLAEETATEEAGDESEKETEPGAGEAVEEETGESDIVSLDAGAEEPTNLYERAASEEEPEYAYREEGKVKRERGKRDVDRTLVRAQRVDAAGRATARMLKAPDRNRAIRYGK